MIHFVIFLWTVTVVSSGHDVELGKVRTEYERADLEPLDFGGHTREFRSENHEWDWDKLARQQVRRQYRRATTTSSFTDEEISSFIASHKDAFKVAKNYLKNLLANEWSTFTTRIKSFDSLKEKLVRKNHSLSDIHDVIGLRIIMSTVSEVRRIADLIVSQNGTVGVPLAIIGRLKCYGICSEPTVQIGLNGYRRIHIIVNILPYNRSAEIQLGTPYTNLWSDWTHDFVYKGKLSHNVEQFLRSYSIMIAGYLYKLDMLRDSLPTCPGDLNRTNAAAILPEESFQFLQDPPNLCFHWTDLNMPLAMKAAKDENGDGSNSAVCAVVAGGLVVSIGLLLNGILST